MSGGVWSQLGAAIDAEDAAVLVTVLATSGSAPREAGARLVVRPSGGFHGTIGGGELEWQALAAARQLTESHGTAAVTRQSVALGPDLGQCCGGRVELLFERFGIGDRGHVRDLAAREELGPFLTRARLEGEGPLRRVLCEVESAGSGEAAAARLEDGGVLEERFGLLRKPLVLFGAGHVGRALVLALAPLPFALTWVDTRADAFPASVPANVTCRHLADPVQALAQAPDEAFVVVMTHSHALDLAITHAALAADRFPHVGLIGSATKRMRFEKRMRAAGLAPAAVARLRCPIGIDGIRSRLPAAIAASTASELLIRLEQTGTGGVEAVAKQRAGAVT